jgi:hypothetical protein
MSKYDTKEFTNPLDFFSKPLDAVVGTTTHLFEGASSNVFLCTGGPHEGHILKVLKDTSDKETRGIICHVQACERLSKIPLFIIPKPITIGTIHHGPAVIETRVDSAMTTDRIKQLQGADETTKLNFLLNVFHTLSRIESLGIIPNDISLDDLAWNPDSVLPQRRIGLVSLNSAYIRLGQFNHFSDEQTAWNISRRASQKLGISLFPGHLFYSLDEGPEIDSYKRIGQYFADKLRNENG